MPISRASRAYATSRKPGADAQWACGFRAVRLIRDLMVLAGQSTDFAPYLDTLRAQYKAKRNFMQRLEAVAAEPEKKAPAGNEFSTP